MRHGTLRKSGIIFLFLGGCAAAFLLVEIVLRILTAGDYYSVFLTPYQFRCFEKGTYYWIRFKPNSHCTLHSNSGAFPDHAISVNSLGLRGPEIGSKQAGATRVLLLGDSFVAGWGVGDGETLPVRTKELLTASGRSSVETINAGLPASGPSYYYLYLTHEGLKLNPDIVVVGLYLFNDIPDNMLFTAWDDVDTEGLPKTARSTLDFVDPTGALLQQNMPFIYKSPLLRQSYALLTIANAWYRALPEQTTTVMNPTLCLYKRRCHDLDTAIEKTKLLFAAMHRNVSEKGKKFLVLFIPVEFQSNRKARQKYGIPIPLLPSEKDYPYRIFSDFFDGKGIEYLDPRPYFVAQKDQVNYYERDNHWTPAGVLVAAEALSERLREMMER